MRLGVRGRATVAFGLIGLFTAIGLALATYFLSRSYLLNQREQGAQRQAFANARLTRSALRTADANVGELLRTIQAESGSDVVVRFHGGWYASSVTTGRDDIPARLRTMVAEGHAGRALTTGPSGDPQIIVGSPLSAVDASYFEVFQLTELHRTLSVLRNVLIAGTIATSVVAGALGRFAAGRIVEPLGPVSSAARRIAGGDLKTRLPDHRDPDLIELTESFNTMAEALESRVERETRFASDVSHELRSPLAAMRAAIDVVERRRADMPASLEPTFELLAMRVRSFEGLVLDLLEISRFDAGAVTLDLEDLRVEEFLGHVLRANDLSSCEVVMRSGAPTTIVADRRRLAQALTTIITNAEMYAGGLTAVGVEGRNGRVRIELDDAGPGIPVTERKAVLQRFARGEAGHRAGNNSGTGLGLALSVAQVELHGGTIEVGSSDGGGARFVIELPVGEVPE